MVAGSQELGLWHLEPVLVEAAGVGQVMLEAVVAELWQSGPWCLRQLLAEAVAGV
jgi:hypothetical protein